VTTQPRWRVPHPYGYASAVDSMGSIAAPLLAATATALFGFVLNLRPEDVRWRNIAFLLLLLSVFAFVATIQLTFWAKRFVVTPSELAEWWPSRPSHHPETLWEQRFAITRFDVWATRCRLAYNVGILLFLASVPLTLIPQGSLHHLDHMRLATVFVAIGAFALEALWILLSRIKPHTLDPLTSVK
jgi:MFS family permease